MLGRFASMTIRGCAAALTLVLWTSHAGASEQSPCASAETEAASEDFTSAARSWTHCIEGGERTPAELARAYRGRGRAFLETNRIAYAIDDFDRAIELTPSDLEAHLLRGLAFQRSGMKKEFFDDMERVIRDSEDDALKARAYRHRGDGYARLKLYGAAIQNLEQALALDERDGEAYFLRAELMNEAGRYDEALKDVNEALRLMPEHAPAYLMRSTLNTMAGNHAEAVRDTEDAVRLDTDNPLAHQRRCEVLNALGIGELAIESCQQVSRLQPDNEERQHAHAFARWQSGDLEAARAVLGFRGDAESKSVENDMIARFASLLGEKLLANLGFSPQDVDGKVDESTDAALAAFAERHGEPASRSFDDETLAHLEAVLHARIPYREGSNDLHPRVPMLVIRTGPAAGRRITLWSIPATLGRGDGQVARIEPEAAGYAIVHVSGEPAPAVNGTAMTDARQPLSDGDTLGLFGVEIAFSNPKQ